MTENNMKYALLSKASVIMKKSLDEDVAAGRGVIIP